MKKKNGFTLIELLAVIIILGILMIIAIPSVTKYISDSRKSAYVDTAKEIVAGTRNTVNEGKLGMYSTYTTYYIPFDYIKSENGTKSPYGEFVYAYVGVIYDGKGYTYYWISVDDAGQGVDEVTSAEILNEDDIKSDINALDIKQKVDSTGIGGRKKVLVLENGSWVTKTENAQNNVPEEGGSSSGGGNIIYPSGKDRNSVAVGDIVSIGTEDFYVINNSGNDLVLLSRYNLNVGNSAKGTATGKQDPDVIGYKSGVTSYGTVAFSSSNYWHDSSTNNPSSSYSGSYYPSNNYPNIYNGSCNLKSYIDNYASMLNVTVKEARLMKVSEADALGCSNNSKSCSGAPSFVTETNYWLGNPKDGFTVWNITTGGSLYGTDYSNSHYAGVRPVIVI